MGGEAQRWGKSDGCHGGGTVMESQSGEGMGGEERGESIFFFPLFCWHRVKAGILLFSFLEEIMYDLTHRF